MASAGFAVQQYGAWSGALFLRCIGSYPLVEDDSRLTGELVEDVTDNHVHPGEPRSFRVSLSYRF